MIEEEYLFSLSPFTRRLHKSTSEIKIKFHLTFKGRKYKCPLTYNYGFVVGWL